MHCNLWQIAKVINYIYCKGPASGWRNLAEIELILCDPHINILAKIDQFKNVANIIKSHTIV